MFHDPLSLGVAVALVQAKIKDNIDFLSFTDNPSNITILENLLVQSKTEKAREMLTSFPNRICRADHPHLQKHDASLASHIIAENSLPDQDEHKGNLIKHLNDCYWCFKHYSQTIKDYHWARQEIKVMIGGNQ